MTEAHQGDKDAVGYSGHPSGPGPQAEAPTGAGAVVGPFLNAIFAPAEAFKALDAKPKLVLWVIVFIALVTTVMSVINRPITQQVMVQTARAQMRASGQDVSAEQLQNMTDTMSTFGAIAAYASSIFVVLSIAIVALLLWVLASVMGGKDSTFLRAFGVASVAAVIHPMLYGIYAGIILNMNPPEIRRPQDASTMAPSLGLDLVVAGPDTPVWLQVLLQRLDLFNLWWALLLVTGAVAVLKLRRGQAITATALIWLLFTLIAMAGALAQGLAG